MTAASEITNSETRENEELDIIIKSEYSDQLTLVLVLSRLSLYCRAQHLYFSTLTLTKLATPI